MRKTVLITGAAGFIGSHTAKKFLENDDAVIGVDNINDYYNPEWKKANLKRLEKYSNFKFFRTDICNNLALEELTRTTKIDIVIHLAARAGVRPSIEKPLLYEEVNVRGTLNMLELARQNQIKQFVFASSSSVYGNQEKIPFSETDPVDEPISPYAATKKSGELLCYSYSHLYDINCICLRFFTVYGPQGRPDMAPYLFTDAILNNRTINKFGDGESKRDYTYIDDIVSGIVAASKLNRRYEIINLGNNSPTSLNEFIHTLEKLTDKKAQLKLLPTQAGDVQLTFADIDKAKKLLNFAPKTDLRTGLKKFIDWYKTERL